MDRQDALTATGLLALLYLTPAKLRPALSLATAIALSRAHGAAHKRLEATVMRLFDEKKALAPRVDDLELVSVTVSGAPSLAAHRRILDRVRAR